MASKRSYGDACGIARAVDVLGRRWALMVVRELLLGPKRFTDIRAGLPHLSADMLAQRLRDLERAGVVTHRKLPPPFAAQVYELTEGGRALEPVLVALGRWGGAYAPPPTDCMSMSRDAYVVSLRTLFDPARAGDFAGRIELRLGDDRVRVEIEDGGIAAERGELPGADAVIETAPETLLDVLHGRRTYADGAGDLQVAGDRRIAKRFTGLFPLPALAP